MGEHYQNPNPDGAVPLNDVAPKLSVIALVIVSASMAGNSAPANGIAIPPTPVAGFAVPLPFQLPPCERTQNSRAVRSTATSARCELALH